MLTAIAGVYYFSGKSICRVTRRAEKRNQLSELRCAGRRPLLQKLRAGKPGAEANILASGHTFL